MEEGWEGKLVGLNKEDTGLYGMEGWEMNGKEEVEKDEPSEGEDEDTEVSSISLKFFFRSVQQN